MYTFVIEVTTIGEGIFFDEWGEFMVNVVGEKK